MPMDHPEYLKIKLAIFPDDVIAHYKLKDKVTKDGFICFDNDIVGVPKNLSWIIPSVVPLLPIPPMTLAQSDIAFITLLVCVNVVFVMCLWLNCTLSVNLSLFVHLT